MSLQKFQSRIGSVTLDGPFNQYKLVFKSIGHRHAMVEKEPFNSGSRKGKVARIP